MKIRLPLLILIVCFMALAPQEASAKLKISKDSSGCWLWDTTPHQTYSDGLKIDDSYCASKAISVLPPGVKTKTTDVKLRGDYKSESELFAAAEKAAAAKKRN